MRHLDERHRHRGQRIGRTPLRLHGTGRQPRRARRCRRSVGRLDLRSPAFCSRRCRKPGRRLHRKAAQRVPQGRFGETARLGGIERRGRSRLVPALRLGSQTVSFPHRQRRIVLMTAQDRWIHTPPRPSAIFDEFTLAEIRRAAATGIYDIRGFGAKRKLPHFDDLLFLGASVSRYPLEGYREKCATDVWLGTRFAKNPIHLKIPITIAGMSFGALGANAKEAIGRACTEIGTSSTTGDGGMTEEERRSSKTLVYQVLPSRYGLNPDDLRRCDAIEVVI